MENLKLRAWDEVKEKLLPVENIEFASSCVFKITLDEGDNTITDFADTMILELFTGLQDRHDEDIYAGDICLFLDNIVLEVEYVNGAFGYYIYHDGDHFVTFSEQIESDVDWMDKIKVIGNIHENSELLKAN